MQVKAAQLRPEVLYQVIKQLGEKSNFPYLILDHELNVMECNENYTKMTLFNAEELQGVPFRQLWKASLKMADADVIESQLQQGKTIKEKLLYIRKNNFSFCAQIAGLPFQNEKGETVYSLIFIEDITNKRIYNFIETLEKDVFISIQQNKSFEQKLTMICVELEKFMLQGELTSVVMKRQDEWHLINARPILHYPQYQIVNEEQSREALERLVGLDYIVLADDLQEIPLPESHERYVKVHDLTHYACVPLRKIDGEVIGCLLFYFAKELIDADQYRPLIDKLQDLILLVAMYEEKQREIYALAYTDIETGMLNRYGFLERMKTNEVKQGQLQIIELTEFSRVVAIYGQRVAEQLIQEINERFYEKIESPNILIGRYTSFSISLFIPYEISLYCPAQHLLDYLAKEPYKINGHEIYITLKSGGVIVDEQMSVEEMLRFAESALSDAREKAGTYASLYNEQKEEEIANEFSLFSQLMTAVKNKEISVYLQPKVELRRGRIVGMEALARWISPTLGFISPADFIPLAEKGGIIREIDMQIIEEVLKWFQRRQYEGKKIVPISINISPDHFYHPYFVQDLQQLIQKYYADPNYIIVEITESLGLVNIEQAQKIIEQLYVHGIKTSVDDFGTGYSSLGYLQKLMFTELKIDRSFTSRIHEVGTYAIVKSLIQIAYNLEMEVVAEGVETEEQANLLRELGCDQVQGYLYYKPMSLQEIEDRGII